MIDFFANVKYHRWIFALVFLSSLLLLTGRFYLTRSVLGGDAIYYYTYIRSLVIDRDLDFENEYQHFYNTISPYTGNRKLAKIPAQDLATGRLPNKYPIGSALLLMPFFILGHICATIFAQFGLPISTDGYGGIYQLATAIGSLVYAFIGLLLIYQFGKKLFNPTIALLGALTICYATPLIYYMTMEPLMSHTVSMFAVTLFIFYWYQNRDNEKLVPWILLGIIGGLMAITRYQDLLFLFIPIVDLVLRSSDGVARRRRLSAAITFISAASLVIAVQLYLNNLFHGSPWLSRYSEKHYLDWTSPHLLFTLFSSHNGLLLWSPITLFSGLGLYWFARRQQWLGVLLISAFLAQWYIISSWSFFSQGATFGNRMLLNCTIIFAVGLMELFARWQQSKKDQFILALVGVTISLNALLAALYCLRIIKDSVI